MWRKTAVAVEGATVPNAMADFAGRIPEILDWPKALALNTPVVIGEVEYFAGRCEACAGAFHVTLMAEPLIPNPVHVAAVAAANAALEAEIAAPAVPDQAKPKGKKK